MRKLTYTFSIIFIIAIMLVLGGCDYDMLESLNNIPDNMAESANMSVRLFVSGDVDNNISFEFIDEDTFVVKEIATRRSPYNTQNPETLFDETLLDDFCSKFPMLEEGVALSSFSIERGLFREVVNTQEIQLTTEQSTYIRNLIVNIIRNGADRDFEWLPMQGENLNYVLAIIDGKAYWSWSVAMPEYYNENLLRLTDKLIELSPIDVEL